MRSAYADNDIVVYTKPNSNTYHLGRCKYYEKMSGGDYSNPQWLADVIMDGTRCTLCISDEMYYTQREGIYRYELEQLEKGLNVLGNVSIALIAICTFLLIAFIVYIAIRKEQQEKSGII